MYIFKAEKKMSHMTLKNITILWRN